MNVSEVMTPRCKTCGQDDSIADAAKAMATSEIGVLPIENGDKLVGVLTDRDIVTRSVALGRDADSTKVQDVMSGQVFYCFDDQSADEVAENMGKMRVRRLPVVNRKKELVGMVSLGDLASRGAADAAGTALSRVSAPG